MRFPARCDHFQDEALHVAAAQPAHNEPVAAAVPNLWPVAQLEEHLTAKAHERSDVGARAKAHCDNGMKVGILILILILMMRQWLQQHWQAGSRLADRMKCIGSAVVSLVARLKRPRLVSARLGGRTKSCFTSFAIATFGAGIGLAIVSTHADAQKITERDEAMLPDYCRVHAPDWRARYERLEGVGITHYCRGLAFTNRVKVSRMTPQERKFLLVQSINEFDYVIRRAPADYVLLPEILTKRGENLFLLGRVSEGLSTLQRAITTKPDYWPPYAVLSDHYKKVGDLEEAREWLEKGIAASPGARALEIRLSELKTKK